MQTTLSPRESEIIYLLSKGKSKLQISKELHLSYSNVCRIINDLRTTFDSANQTELVAAAIRAKVIE